MTRTRSLSSVLDPLGEHSGDLRGALVLLARHANRAFGIPCTVHSPDTIPALAPDVALHLYRIVQEAIHNAVRHGHARSIRVVLTVDREQLAIRIVDDGSGFEPGNPDLRAGHGMGLRIMRYRAAASQATMEVTSAPGKGCQIRCALRLPQANKTAS